MKTQVLTFLAALVILPFTISVEASFGRASFSVAFATSANGERTKDSKITKAFGKPICEYHQVDIPTSLSGPPRQSISVEDLTPTLVSLLEESGMKHGTINVISRHTTTAITINEREKRLAEDMEKYFYDLLNRSNTNECFK